MVPRLRTVHATLLLCGVLLVSGWTAGVPAGETTTPISTPTPTPTSPESTNTSGCVQGVSFWGLSGPNAEQRWSTDVVRIGYTLPPNAFVLLVVYSDDTVLGVTSEVNRDDQYAVAADGDSIHLDTRLNGTHTIRVVAVEDANRNGAFDPEVDTLCRRDGSLVQAGPRAIEFGRVDANRTTENRRRPPRPRPEKGSTLK